MGTFSRKYVVPAALLLALVVILALAFAVPSAQAVGSDVTVTLELLDSAGDGLSGGTVKYWDTAWHAVPGSTDVNGEISFDLPAGNYQFQMWYKGKGQQKGPFTLASAPVTVSFQTVAMKVRLETCDNTGLLDGTASFYAGSWQPMGMTSDGGNTAAEELLPGSYSFGVKYLGKWQQFNSVPVSDTATNPVVFQTTTVSLYYSGGITFYESSWQTFQKPTMEMLPGTYNNFKFDGITKSLTFAGCESSQAINVLKVKDHTGSPIEGATARGGFNTNFGSWFVPKVPGSGAGTTDANGVIFDVVNVSAQPNDMSYEMKVNNTTESKTQDVAANSVFEFDTNLLTLRLEDCSLNPLDDGKPRWGNGSSYGTRWFPSGSGQLTGSSAPGEVAAEVFPGEYSFEMQYNSTAEKKLNVILPDSDQLLTWQTSTVTLPYPGTISYGGPVGDSTWFAQPTMELLSGTYKFHFRPYNGYPGFTTDIVIAGCDTVKTLISVAVDDCAGGYLPGVAVQWFKYGKANTKFPAGTTTAGGPLTFFIDGVVDYKIEMYATYLYRSLRSGRQNPATNPFFSYTAQLAEVSFEDHEETAVPITAANNLKFYAWGAANKPHNTMALVGGNGEQCLLPGNYVFKMEHNKTFASSGRHNIDDAYVFQTGAAQNGSFVASKYYQWGHAGNKGDMPPNGPIELLPARVVFRGSTSSQQHVIVAGSLLTLTSP